MVFHMEAVRLKDKPCVQDQLFILGAAVTVAAGQETLIPLTAGAHLADAEKRLRAVKAEPLAHLPIV